jgi:hypothetical protein
MPSYSARNGKAPEDWRGPKRFAISRVIQKTPVLGLSIPAFHLKQIFRISSDILIL